MTATAGTLSGTVSLSVNPGPPTIEGIQIDDGTGQFSMVRTLTITFNEQVDLSSAFEVQRTTGAPLDLPLALSTPITEGIQINTSLNGSGDTVAVINFVTQAGGDPITAPSDPAKAGPYGSLPDGNYMLTVFAAGVSTHGVPSQTMAANSYTTFHRLFGDAVGGNRLVNAADLRQFDASLNNAGNYKSIFDFNGDGLVNSADLRQFDARLNNAQFPAAPPPPSVVLALATPSLTNSPSAPGVVRGSLTGGGLTPSGVVPQWQTPVLAQNALSALEIALRDRFFRHFKAGQMIQGAAGGSGFEPESDDLQPMDRFKGF